MKRVFAWGLFFVFYTLFSLFKYPLITCSADVQKSKLEPLDAQIIMDNLVKASEEKRIQGFEITYDEAQMLMKIAMAEAEADGTHGKAMVMAVVLNRVNDDRFPDSIEGVIFQDGQFSPISDGRYYDAEPDIECHLALAQIEMGEYDTVDALYFENAGDCWQSNNCEYLGTVGHHKFYKN